MKKALHAARGIFQKVAAFLVFIREWLSSPRSIGMVCPSGSFLCRSLAAQIPDSALSDGSYVVELGAGTGSVTRTILARGVSPSRFLIVERSERMVHLLRMRFPGLRVIHADAAELADFVPKDARVSCVVSSLPLVSLPDDVRRGIVRVLEQVLFNGILIQYTYSWAPGSFLERQGFRRESCRRVWLNLPPARVLTLTPPRVHAAESASPRRASSPCRSFFVPRNLFFSRRLSPGLFSWGRAFSLALVRKITRKG